MLFRSISLQRLECGYTEARPFKTINRAVIEAAIITSRSYLDITPAPCGDLVSIVLAPGVHTVYNGLGLTIRMPGPQTSRQLLHNCSSSTTPQLAVSLSRVVRHWSVLT